MRKKRDMPFGCIEVREALEARVLEGGDVTLSPWNPGDSTLAEPLESGSRAAGSLAAHLRTCVDCRRSATDLERLHRSLLMGFRRLSSDVPPLSEERIGETIRQVQSDVSLDLWRRLRRAVRLIVWTAFYAFTLLAASLLAVALYQALKGQG